MDQKELKRLMTDVAKGKISEKDAQLLIKPKKTRQKGHMKEKEGKKNAHKRKGLTKSREVK